MTDETADRLGPFALIGDETRARIVETLGEARLERGVRPTLSFSDLRSRADLDVPSSQFNYHLQHLLGTFVEKTEAGYRMRVEGRVVYHALRAGTFARAGADAARRLAMACHYCEGDVEAVFDDGVASVRCRACEHCYEIMGVPPVVVADETDAVERFAAYSRQKQFAFAGGHCSTCGNAVETEFRRSPDLPFDEHDRGEVSVYRPCDHCGDQLFLSVGEVLLYDPGVVSFCHERGLDVLNTPHWEIPFAATDETVSVLDTDPWRLSLRIPLAGDELELVVDERLAVVERRSR